MKHSATTPKRPPSRAVLALRPTTAGYSGNNDFLYMRLERLVQPPAVCTLLEDQVAVQNAREIVSTPGVSVAIPGPGDLRRAYEGDMEAVENAIQTVLAACKEFDVPCGITAGVDDIAERLGQGFRLIIVTNADALAVGRAAAGRNQ